MSFLYTTAIFLFFILLQNYTAQNLENITAQNPLIIGVPSKSFSSKFVQKEIRSEGDIYGGFSIKVLEEAQKLLGYKIYFKFVEYVGTYDDLVASVGNKDFGWGCGRHNDNSQAWDLATFTVPYTESGLAMVVPLKRAEPWIFLKPFSLGLWLATGGVLLYTMLIVWFIEHRSNEEFGAGGSWQHQLGFALWFTFTSLFTAHRETVKSNHTRVVVVVVWLFLVLIVMQSFTASLSALLTVKRLNPNVDLLSAKDTKVGCNPFIKKFVQNELGYKSENIVSVCLERDYLDAFKRGTISAALLEIPYAKLLVNSHCKEYGVTGSSYQFGGLTFVFQKNSQIANDLSKAILTLSETGMLKRLEKSWLTSSSECSVDSNSDQKPDSLDFWSFWGLHLFSASITTTSFLFFIVRLLRNYRYHQETQINNIVRDGDKSVWKKVVRVLRCLKNTKLPSGENMPSSQKISPEIQLHSCRF